MCESFLKTYILSENALYYRKNIDNVLQFTPHYILQSYSTAQLIDCIWSCIILIQGTGERNHSTLNLMVHLTVHPPPLPFISHAPTTMARTKKKNLRWWLRTGALTVYSAICWKGTKRGHFNGLTGRHCKDIGGGEGGSAWTDQPLQL